jgi:hypothetical protein
VHPGLPWAGCTILSAPAEQLARLRARAGASERVFVAHMPAAAQHTRVYDEYLQQLTTSAAGEITYYAVSVIGPRKRVAKLVHGMELRCTRRSAPPASDRSKTKVREFAKSGAP